MDSSAPIAPVTASQLPPNQDQPYAQNQNRPYPQYQNPPVAIPGEITLLGGTFMSVRINQPLSSDRNHEGDEFLATLTRPLIASGVVIAERGQTIGGRVAQVKKGSHGAAAVLGVELTDLTIADGSQVPIHSQLVSYEQPRSVGRDIATIGTTTILGAAIGGAAGNGTGAAIGAAVGAVAGTIGAGLTPGRPAVIYPESTLSFRITNPVVIATTQAPQAFRPVNPGDYQQAADAPRLQGRPQGPNYYGPGYYGNPYYYGPYYGYGYGYPYYGPGFGVGVVIGPRFGGHRR